MKFREAVKCVNDATKVFLKHDHWELKEAICFYKQAFSDFWYASKMLLSWVFSAVLFLLLPVVYPALIIIRMVKK